MEADRVIWIMCAAGALSALVTVFFRLPALGLACYSLFNTAVLVLFLISPVSGATNVFTAILACTSLTLIFLSVMFILSEVPFIWGRDEHDGL